MSLVDETRYWKMVARGPRFSIMDDTSDAPQSPQRWLDDLEESEAELAAGQTVKSGPLRQRLRDSIARLEARLESEKKPKATTPP